jgi:quercetin dioxygenase-like cupin family protein
MKNLIFISFTLCFLSCNINPAQYPNKIYASERAKHFEFSKVPFDTLNDGVLRKLVYGDNLQQTDVIIKKGYLIPKHNHVSEQMSTILKGKFKATIFYKNKTEEIILNKGDVFFIPSNIPHKYEALEDSEVLETFFPVRKDMIK